MNHEIKEYETKREIFWVCLYCETSNESEYHICEVCTNERIYTHEEVSEIVGNGGFKSGKIELNHWAVAAIAFLILVLIVSHF